MDLDKRFPVLMEMKAKLDAEAHRWVEEFENHARHEIEIGSKPYPEAPNPAEALVPRLIPKKIWIYWAQGWARAPEQCKLCLKSWQRLNTEWDLNILDDASLSRVTDLSRQTFRSKALTITGFSNLLRLDLLERHGGVWVDASTFCSKPLADWLPPLMQSGFFAFSRPGPDRLLSTWFLASEVAGSLVSRWHKLLHAYWSTVDRSDFYFWTHYLFAEGCRSDPEMRRLWHVTPWISADGPHQVQVSADRTDAIDDIAASIAERRVPVHKLESKRIALPSPADRTPLSLLLHGSNSNSRPQRHHLLTWFGR